MTIALSVAPALSYLDEPRRVFVISPQPWDGFKVSKHHYAAELAEMGHSVWFINPPVASGRPGSASIAATEISRLRQVTYRTWFPYRAKFRLRAAFDMAMRRQARLLVRAIGAAPDLVWDFDNAYQFADLSVFGAGRTIFHLVDEPGRSRHPAKSADLILSVAGDFLVRIGEEGRGRVIPHGLSKAHEAHARKVLAEPGAKSRTGRRPRVGYVGNLDHPGIDWQTISTLVERFPDVDFRFTGPYRGHPGSPTASPLHVLAGFGNVVLEGPKPAAEILRSADEVDIWLICYDAGRTVDGATNSHKALEYLATGSPVLSNRLHAYAGSDLLVMPDSPSNHELRDKLGWMLSNLDELNRAERRTTRADFALAHSYESHVRQIAGLLDEQA